MQNTECMLVVCTILLLEANGRWTASPHTLLAYFSRTSLTLHASRRPPLSSAYIRMNTYLHTTWHAAVCTGWRQGSQVTQKHRFPSRQGLKDPEKGPRKEPERVVPAWWLLRLPVAGGQMSWQCIVHCIGMASGTRPIPVHHETAPASAQSASSTPCGSREGVPAHAQGPNQARRPTPPCVFASQHRRSSTKRYSVAAPRMSNRLVWFGLVWSMAHGIALLSPLSVCPLFSLSLSPSAPINHVKMPLSQ